MPTMYGFTSARETGRDAVVDSLLMPWRNMITCGRRASHRSEVSSVELEKAQPMDWGLLLPRLSI